VTSAAALPSVLLDAVATCRACDSMAYSHVIGATNGPANARVMFVGEAPGRHGAGKSGVPFQGDESGRRFEALLQTAGLTRDDVFVTNAILCNPLQTNGNNRRPKASEVKRCLPHLRAQIETVDPALVVALGEVALAALHRIDRHTLRLRDATATPVPWFNRRLLALYHPGRRALVHRNEALQNEDWQALGTLIGEIRSAGCD
jgi:uracil-DNA glycosylase family 4